MQSDAVGRAASPPSDAAAWRARRAAQGFYVLGVMSYAGDWECSGLAGRDKERLIGGEPQGDTEARGCADPLTR